jgi:hypothetical protein
MSGMPLTGKGTAWPQEINCALIALDDLSLMRTPRLFGDSTSSASLDQPELRVIASGLIVAGQAELAQLKRRIKAT